MLKNNKLISSWLTGAATTINLKLQSLDPVYTRLLNKNIDITQIKKVNSEKKSKNTCGCPGAGTGPMLAAPGNVNILIDLIDYFIFIIVILTLLNHFIFLFSSLINVVLEYYNISGSDLIFCMVENSKTAANVATTSVSTDAGYIVSTTTIIHDDGSWINAVRSLFIYGAGAYRISLLRGGGTPGGRAFIVMGSVLGDAASKILFNIINDSTYVRGQAASWKYLWGNRNEGQVRVDPGQPQDEDTLSKISTVTNNKFLGDDFNIEEFIQVTFKGLFKQIAFLIEPVQVNYSNEILAEQIYYLSIFMFFLALLIMGLLIILIFNMFIYINMDKIIKIFNNKYIKGYLNINKKFIGFEIFFTGGLILYFMYSLTVALRFIATHPITIV